MPDELTAERLVEIRERLELHRSAVDYGEAFREFVPDAEAHYVQDVPLLLAAAERLRAELSNIADLKLKHLEIRDGKMIGSAQSWLVPFLAQSMADVFDAEGGINYVEWEVSHTEKGPLVLTLQRKLGKTPGVLKREAEEECERLRAENEQLRRHLNPPYEMCVDEVS